MGIAAEPPQRHDLGLRENDDKLLGVRWVKGDGTTPIVITEARLGMRLDPLTTLDDEGEPVPPVEVLIDATTSDPLGWVDTSRFDEGELIVYLSHGLWAEHPERHGVYDLVAVSADGVQRCLLRGELTVDVGVTV